VTVSTLPSDSCGTAYTTEAALIVSERHSCLAQPLPGTAVACIRYKSRKKRFQPPGYNLHSIRFAGRKRWLFDQIRPCRWWMIAAPPVSAYLAVKVTLVSRS